MNSPFPNFVTAQLAYDRHIPSFQSEADRQDRIDARAKEIEREMTASLMTDQANAQDVAVDLFSLMDEELCVRVLRAFLSNDERAHRLGRALILAQMDETVQKLADLRAIREEE